MLALFDHDGHAPDDKARVIRFVNICRRLVRSVAALRSDVAKDMNAGLKSDTLAIPNVVRVQLQALVQEWRQIYASAAVADYRQRSTPS